MTRLHTAVLYHLLALVAFIVNLAVLFDVSFTFFEDGSLSVGACLPMFMCYTRPSGPLYEAGLILTVVFILFHIVKD